MANDTVTVKILGLDQLQKAMEELPREVAKKGLRQALRAGGEVMQEGFAANAPEDTGFLKEHFNMRTKIKREDIAGSIFVGPDAKADYPDKDGGYREKVNAKGRKTLVGSISVASVARFLEFGTSKMAKRPFMTQTFETRKGAALDAIIDKLKAVLAEVVKK